MNDQGTIDRLLEDSSLHFTERYLRYQKQDVRVEIDLLSDYYEWAAAMPRSTCHTDKARKEFLFDLQEAVDSDCKTVSIECGKLRHALNARKQQLALSSGPAEQAAEKSRTQEFERRKHLLQQHQRRLRNR